MWGMFGFHPHTYLESPILDAIEITNTPADNFLAAITFLAQWHPLIVPRRGDLRPEFAHS